MADDTPVTVEWKGETFRIGDGIGIMSRVWFGKLAAEGADTGDMEAGAAISDMLEDSLAEGEYPRFREHARKTRADMDDLLLLCRLTMEALADRPTGRPSDSSDGPETTEQPSSAPEETPVERVLSRIPDTRPDLRMVVAQGAAARSAASA